jgi:acetyl esterase
VDLQERLAAFASLNRLPEMPVDAARQVNDREASVMFGQVEPVFAVEERNVAGRGGDIRVRLYRPDAEVGVPMLIYFHGGGWVVGSLDSHDGVARFLAKFGRCLVISVAYRLAPEHKFPAAVEDAWEATRWARQNAAGIGADADRLAVGGDSSGGNLAAVVARWARDRGLPLKLQLLVYPALDCSMRAQEGAGEFGYWVSQYLGAGTDAAGADVSPLLAQDLRGVAPAVILSCGLDPLHKQAEAYARRLHEAGVPAEQVLYPGLVHGAYRMPAVLTDARKMLDDSAAALLKTFRRVS